MKKKLITAIAIMTISLPLFADDPEGPQAFALIIGPRIGASYVLDTPDRFSAGLRMLYPAGNFFPAFTLFGVTVEQRIVLGQTKSHFAFQEALLIGGLEQGIALPEGAFLIGYRDYAGLEFGIGPILSFAGIGVVAAVGWTFSYQGAFVPIDVSVILPSGNRPAAIGLTTGFNFQISRTEQTQLQ